MYSKKHSKFISKNEMQLYQLRLRCEGGNSNLAKFNEEFHNNSIGNDESPGQKTALQEFSDFFEDIRKNFYTWTSMASLKSKVNNFLIDLNDIWEELMDANEDTKKVVRTTLSSLNVTTKQILLSLSPIISIRIMATIFQMITDFLLESDKTKLDTEVWTSKYFQLYEIITNLLDARGFVLFVENIPNISDYQTVILGFGAGSRVDQAIPRFAIQKTNKEKVLVLQVDPSSGFGFNAVTPEKATIYLKEMCQINMGCKLKNIEYRLYDGAFPLRNDSTKEISFKTISNFIQESLIKLFRPDEKDVTRVLICSIDISGCGGNLLTNWTTFEYPAPQLVVNAYSAHAAVYSGDVQFYSPDETFVLITPSTGVGFYVKALAGMENMFDAQNAKCTEEIIKIEKKEGYQQYDCMINLITLDIFSFLLNLKKEGDMPKPIKFFLKFPLKKNFF